MVEINFFAHVKSENISATELQNKARNSHKPRLGKYVQQGNVDRIEDVFRGIPFHVYFGKGVDSENLTFTGAANTCIAKYFEI